MADAPLPTFTTLRLTRLGEYAVEVALNRPRKSNAIDGAMWRELRACFEALAALDWLRVVLLTGGDSKNFCAGIDLADLQSGLALGIGVGRPSEDDPDAARRALGIRKHILYLQGAFDAIEALPVPVVAVVHGACFGGAIDLITACDVRWAAAGSRFSVKEVDIGLCADVGTLARLPKVIGSQSLVRELCLTGREFDADEAAACGLVSRLCGSREALQREAAALAATIAAKSPLAIAGTKANLLFARDHGVAEANRYTALWNAAGLQSDDLGEAAAARSERRAPVFARL